MIDFVAVPPQVLPSSETDLRTYRPECADSSTRGRKEILFEGSSEVSQDSAVPGISKPGSGMGRVYQQTGGLGGQEGVAVVVVVSVVVEVVVEMEVVVSIVVKVSVTVDVAMNVAVMVVRSGVCVGQVLARHEVT